MERRVTFYEETSFKTTEIGEIPADWEAVKLGELANIQIGRTPARKEKESWENGSFPWVSISDMKPFGTITETKEKISNYALEKYFKNVSRAGTLLMSFKLTIGRTSILAIDAVHNEAIVSIYPIGSIDKMYLLYYLPTIDFSKYFDKAVKGNTLNKDKMLVIPIAIPPVEEQKAIAYVLSAVQEAREKTEKVIEAAKELKKSLMKHLFTYGPVSLEEASRINLKETEIGEIPADWEVVKLGEVVTEESPPTEKDPEVSVIPFIPMALIPEDGIFVNSWELRRREDIRSGIQVFEGDLLVAKITPCFENGKQGIVSQLPLPYAYATTEVLRLRARERIILEYVALFLKQGSVRTLLASKMQGTTGRKRLSRHVLKDLPLPLPPLPVQKRIAEILQTVDEKIQAEEKKKQALGNLFNSMLHMLMSGKLRVKFQTSEEGASN